MPQNNQSIVNSQEFKEFVKENNLEVLNLESFQLAIYEINLRNRLSIAVMQERVTRLEERLMKHAVILGPDIINEQRKAI